jgi:UDPglucose 6-dehydrogenase
MRDASSLAILPPLMDKGAIIRAHDPEGMKEAQHLLPQQICYCDSVYDTFKDADATVLMTEWNQYRGLDLARVKGLMKGNTFIDLRNVYEHDIMSAHGFDYYCVGR